MHRFGQFLGISGNLVHGYNLATHEYRLRKGYGSKKYIMHVEAHRRLRQICHLFGHRLSVDYKRQTCGRICHQVECVSLSVEVHYRQMLVGSKYVYVIGVVDISSCKINLREICGKCLFFLISCGSYLLCLDAQLLVVGHGHGAAGIERHGFAAGFRHLCVHCGGRRE